MSPELGAFLAAEDLDEVLNARQKISDLDTDDAAVIRSVLDQWQNPQAVSNLLLHPTVIPLDIRLTSLFRGVGERRVAYYVLAAVVGFQSIDPAKMIAADRTRAVEELLAVIRKTSGVLAQRASISIQRFLGEEDAPRVFALWAHRDDTVWHNLRAWLFRTFLPRGVQLFAIAARASGLAEGVQRDLVEDFTELAANPRDRYDSRLGELFGYIPNLRDCGQSAEPPRAPDRGG
jgi:hypothetical protein